MTCVLTKLPISLRRYWQSIWKASSIALEVCKNSKALWLFVPRAHTRCLNICINPKNFLHHISHSNRTLPSIFGSTSKRTKWNGWRNQRSLWKQRWSNVRVAWETSVHGESDKRDATYCARWTGNLPRSDGRLWNWKGLGYSKGNDIRAQHLCFTSRTAYLGH